MDKRLDLALKYYDVKLPDEAWKIVADLVAAPDAGLEVLGFAAALRLQARAFAEVVALADRMLALDGENPGAWLFKTQALFHAGEASADIAFRKALSLAGKHPAGWNNLGNALDALGDFKKARKAFRRAIAEAPELSLAHNNLGASFAGQGEFAAAAASYRQALQVEPGNLAALNNLGVALLEQGLPGEAVATFETVLALDPENRDAADNRLYATIYTESDPRVVHSLHAAWGKAQPPAPALKPRDPQPERKLRVGYVSSDFRQHSVSFFAAPLLAAHDPAAVEVFCYADVVTGDAITRRIKKAAHHWRNIARLSDTEVFDQVRADQIDILVDLAGHTKGNRLPVFARRAAPVQVTAIGYPATTGLPVMDYRLVDGVSDPAPEADGWAVERLIRLAGMHCYEPPADAPAPGPLPALVPNPVTFGSFNKFAKVSPETVALWARILRAAPEARLILKSKPLVEAETRARVADMFAAHGIAAARLDLRGWTPGDTAHLELYREVDIALDTVPYNGTTTTCEALWMGVPVLTLLGQGHAGRVGASLLMQAGLRDWVATTPEQYVARAAEFVSDLASLAALRKGLRKIVAASQLCDAKAYARNVEKAYRAMWRQATAADSSEQ